MKLIFENWRKFINEYGGRAMGGNLATISGAGRQPMPATMPPKNSKPELGGDSDFSVKAILHRNGMILLIQNDKGWDLPGGHMKNGENKIAALVREVFEETGLNISDIQDMNMQIGNKHFFTAQFLTDDVILSDEHHKYDFFDSQQCKQLNDLSDDYKQAIASCII